MGLHLDLRSALPQKASHPERAIPTEHPARVGARGTEHVRCTAAMAMSQSRDRECGRVVAAATVGALAMILLLPTGARADIQVFPIPDGSRTLHLVSSADGLWFGDAAGLESMSTTGGVTVALADSSGPASPDGTLTPYPLAATPGGGVWACWGEERETTEFGPTICNTDDSPLVHVTSAASGYQILKTAYIECEFETGSDIASMTAGPEGAMWFDTELGIGSISPTGAVTSFCPSPQFEYQMEFVGRIVLGSDSALWFIAATAWPDGKYVIGHMTTAGVFSYYPVEENTSIEDLTPGPNGNIWFTTLTTSPASLPRGGVGEIAPDGAMTHFTLPEGVHPSVITAGPDGALWFRAFYDGVTQSDDVARLTPDGAVTYYYLPENLENLASCVYNPGAADITVGPDGAIWTNDECALVRITTGTPGASTPAPITPTTSGSPTLLPTGQTTLPVSHTSVHPIVVPPDVKRALSTAKLDAEVSKNVVDQADTGMLMFKLVLATAEPELAFELLIPDQFDAAEFGAETALGDLAADPPRSDFTQIASTTHTALGGVAVHGGVTQRRLRAWSRLISDTEADERYMRALTLSVERLEGAAVQGECTWMRRQAQAASEDAKEARRYLARDPLDVKLLRQALSAAGVHNPSITTAQFRRMQGSVARKGLPADVVAALRRSGLGAAEITRVTTLITQAKPRSVHFVEALGQSTRNLLSLSHALHTFASVTDHTIRCTPA